MPPFSFIPIVHGHSLYYSHPNLPRVLSTWHKNLKQGLFLSSAVVLNGSCQCTGTHCPAVLLPKTPVSYAMTLQKSNLALVGEGPGMRLLAYHPLSSYSRQQRYPLHIVSRFSIWCIVSSSKTGYPLHPTTANPNSIKKTLKSSNHARRFAYLVQEQMHLSLAWGAIKAQRETFVDFIFYQICSPSVFSWSHAAKLIHSHANLLSWDDNIADLIYLHKWLSCKHQQLEDVQW